MYNTTTFLRLAFLVVLISVLNTRAYSQDKFKKWSVLSEMLGGSSGNAKKLIESYGFNFRETMEIDDINMDLAVFDHSSDLVSLNQGKTYDPDGVGIGTRKGKVKFVMVQFGKMKALPNKDIEESFLSFRNELKSNDYKIIKTEVKDDDRSSRQEYLSSEKVKGKVLIWTGLSEGNVTSISAILYSDDFDIQEFLSADY